MESQEIFDILDSNSKTLESIAKLWALEQIKNISDPKEAYQKFNELHKAFLEANSQATTKR